MHDNDPQTGAGWRRLGVLVLAFAAVGLPVNDIAVYVPLLIVTVVIFVGQIRTTWRAWLAAIAIVAVAIAGQIGLAPPRIDEGHNVFLPGPAGRDDVLARGLPADVYRHLKTEFDKQYPPAKRCNPKAAGCWLSQGLPDRVYAFSADGIFHPSDMSRAVTEIDFSDPVWQRLGFINDSRYNWYPASDVQRARRDGRFWMGLHRWHLAMPWFEMIRLPAAFVGGRLCWRGDVMWEGADERFSLWRGDQCRAIEPADAGRRVAGIAIKPDSLAMRLEPPLRVRLLQLTQGALTIAALFGLVLALVRFRPRRLILPFIVIGLSAAVIAIADGSFLGGVRPFDGGDDGLFYEGLARAMVQKLLAGDWIGFLVGGEPVFYYGGPGLRYFYALGHIVFGDSFLGYLSLVLLLPFLVYGLFRRFLPSPWPIVIVLGFVAVPVGTLFGTTFIDYAKWAARGFADPAAYILFIAGLLVLVGGNAGSGVLRSNNRFVPALFGALLLALGIAMKPIVAPAAAVFLGGAGLAALYDRQWPRLAGLCIGFAPVFSMALHNWVFGRVFVLFSSNAQDSNLLVMPPSAYVSALRELVTLDFSGGHMARGFFQIVNWLSGPAESAWTLPLNVFGVVILVFVVTRGRRFDPWLRLIGASALAQHTVALFYEAGTARYHFLAWFLTMLVVMVFVHDVGLDWLRRRYPMVSERIVRHPWSVKLASGLSWFKKVSP
ncbi:MAG: hypothetical protein K9G60_08460 [Pseudolabrys sp.]|nr:hypothetical protein [Pseudolabrys sp.]